MIALRDLGIGLVLICVVSFLPMSLTQSWPEPAGRAVEIARDIRVLLFDVVRKTAVGVGSLLSFGDGGVAAPVRATAEPTLGWWPFDRRAFGALAASDAPRSGIAGSFDDARTVLLDTVYADRRVTFFCGCRYDLRGRIDLAGCGLGVLVGSRRAEQVEAAHVVSAAQLGGSRRCWREPAAFAACTAGGAAPLSGTACCERVDPAFAAAHQDLHNLVPAVGAITAARSDHVWGELRSGQQLGDCAIRFDPILRRVQPPEEVRGDIARTVFYMRDTHGVRLGRQDVQRYTAWSNADPPDAPEIERNRRIRRVQGRGNRYVEDERRFRASLETAM
ncbi:endonuclease [Thiocapsa roseopersicina]|uniref:Deoxyribonuclease-1 n=1 Tax=Thiocapsa roseopersicina TaxID=1058 RepID=A0A1H3ALT9_THIRO|nr:endonuclease [Thiocapsa roseopersicina]SDX29789.1 deoxyribonuclease-1 [Thiocapsa roseopersicina]